MMWSALSHWPFWVSLSQIVLIDLVLSGDNAVVIALAARSLVGRDRHRALFFGGISAIIFRMFLTVIAAGLLSFPYLMSVGGGLLFWVAVKLVRQDEGEHESSSVPALSHLWQAIRAIVIADVVMSLDNILSIAALARGNPLLLLLGLMISIPLILAGSALLIHLMRRFPMIILLSGGLLGYVSMDMLLSDHAWQSMIVNWPQSLRFFLSGAVGLIVLVYGQISHRKNRSVGS